MDGIPTIIDTCPYYNRAIEDIYTFERILRRKKLIVELACRSDRLLRINHT